MDKGAPFGVRHDATNSVLETDIVYVRDFVHAERMASDQLKHLALISHACYGSFDLAGRCVALLEQRNALPADALQQYVELINRRAQGGRVPDAVQRERAQRLIQTLGQWAREWCTAAPGPPHIATVAGLQRTADRCPS
jgi:hypothetical protein